MLVCWITSWPADGLRNSKGSSSRLRRRGCYSDQSGSDWGGGGGGVPMVTGVLHADQENVFYMMSHLCYVYP